MLTVPAITLDDFIAGGSPPPDLLKIDVEGGEAEVLRGGASLLAGKRPLIIVEGYHEQAAAQIRFWMYERRYRDECNLRSEPIPRQLFACQKDSTAQVGCRRWNVPAHER